MPKNLAVTESTTSSTQSDLCCFLLNLLSTSRTSPMPLFLTSEAAPEAALMLTGSGVDTIIHFSLAFKESLKPLSTPAGASRIIISNLSL